MKFVVEDEAEALDAGGERDGSCDKALLLEEGRGGGVEINPAGVGAVAFREAGVNDDGGEVEYLAVDFGLGCV